ncbi:MAG: hypothetical protein JWO22_2476 [Frankiales bacterium]|nr:hypothetical protein [Frankiales bacterium]
MERLTTRQARRIALAAQGFNDALPPAVTARHLRRVVERTQLLQIDSVNVFARAHTMPVFARVGSWDIGLLDSYAFRRRQLFEFWGHEASFLPVELHPLLRWRMARNESRIARWGFETNDAVLDELLKRVEEGGPTGAGALRDGPRARNGTMWDWDHVKVGLEFLFSIGRLTTRHRTTGFERIYDLTERVLPAAVLDLPTPSLLDAHRALLALSAKAHGVATARSLKDYFRLRGPVSDEELRSLVDEGALVPVTVDGDKAYLDPTAARPRWVRRAALLSPFDPLVWERARTERLWGVDYRIEIYTPAAKRVYGYYCLLFLHDEAIRARVDLKSDRKAGVLRVMTAWKEPEWSPESLAALTVELQRAAAWQGLGAVVVEDRGDLARDLARQA